MIPVEDADHRVDLGIEGLGPGVLVGRGGFATVYRAVQVRARGEVAVKVLSGHLDELALSRFERETAALVALRDHPNICTVYDAGVDAEGRPFLVMEYAARGSLAQRLINDGPLSWAEALDVVVKLAGALEAAHQAGLLHRDVKPENVLLTRYGPQLADFGLARFTDDSMSRGGLTTTVAHAAPELLRGQPPTVRSDVYALGSTLFQVLTGHVAFAHTEEAHPVSVYRRIEEDPVPELGPDLPDAVAAVVRTAMAKDPAERYPSAAGMGIALQDVQRAQQLAVTPLPLPVDEVLSAARHAHGPRDDADTDDLSVGDTARLPRYSSGDANKTRTVDRPDRPKPPVQIEPPPDHDPVVAAKRRPSRRTAVIATGVAVAHAAARMNFDVITGPQPVRCTKAEPQPPIALSYECTLAGTTVRVLYLDDAVAGTHTPAHRYLTSRARDEGHSLLSERDWSYGSGEAEGTLLSIDKGASGFSYVTLWEAAPSWALVVDAADEATAVDATVDKMTRPSGADLPQIDAAVASG